MRAETIRVLDVSTGAVLDTRSLSAGSFHNGTYLVWNVSGQSGSFELVQGKDVVSLDTDGNEILSQSGDVRKFGDTYYWYGDRIVNGVRIGIACYSSKGLSGILCVGP